MHVITAREATRILVARTVMAIGFIVYVIAVALLLRVTTKPPPPSDVTIQPDSLQKEVVKKPAAFSAPVRLTIPTIKVDAAIASAGLTADGLMDIKKNPADVAWYKFGPAPGNVGSAVIAGHYGWENGRGSVFNELHTLRPGSMVSVKDQKGAIVSFVIREIKLYDPSADASAVFTSKDGKAHLNLITCEGVWDNEERTYSRRLVVFTDKKG